MTLSLIGAGFGRTGTKSTKLALETLGYGPCHHMEEVFTNQDQLPHWRAAVDEQAVDWERAFAGYRSAIDWPSTHYWRELADYYPQAKVLLSVRPAEVWWNSFSGTIAKLLEIRESVPDDYVRSILDMANKMIAEQTFGNEMRDKKSALIAFQKRIDDVSQAIPAERLLVFDVAQGWEPLCEFLDLPVPREDFPKTNSREEFWETFGGNLENS